MPLKKKKKENGIPLKRKLLLFVLMPFKDELLDFYRIIQRCIQNDFNITVLRVDDRYYSRPFSSQIQDFIFKADIILADCSSGNPNVMWELGIATAYSKPIIYITSDSSKDIPANIRHYNFLFYNPYKALTFVEEELVPALIELLKTYFIPKELSLNLKEEELESQARVR